MGCADSWTTLHHLLVAYNPFTFVQLNTSDSVAGSATLLVLLLPFSSVGAAVLWAVLTLTRLLKVLPVLTAGTTTPAMPMNVCLLR